MKENLLAVQGTAARNGSLDQQRRYSSFSPQIPIYSIIAVRYLSRQDVGNLRIAVYIISVPL